jgi:hypothetical protein
MPGIYAVIHRSKGSRYVGSAQSTFRRRWAEHRRSLARGAHSSPLLQADHDRDGPDQLEFRTLLYCEPFECIRYEQFFLDCCRHLGILYNANPWVSWFFSDRGGKGYLPPREAYERQDAIRGFNKLYRAMIAEGIPRERAHDIAAKLYREVLRPM